MRVENETMRKPCECGSEVGYVEVKSGQQCMYCTECGTWQYNKPKERPSRSGYDTISTLHLVELENGSKFYAGRNGKDKVYLFKNDDGSVSYCRKLS